ncbi:MAG: hypothetical protein ABI072_05280 [Edaphobacter sp.]
MRLLRSAVAGVVFLLMVTSGWVGRGQMSQQPLGPVGRPNPGLPSIDGRNPNDHDVISGRIVEQQTRSRNSDRQKRLVDETNRLVSLAEDLKLQVEKGNKDVTSVDSAKKAEEIEKLAKSVRDRMKG